MGTRSCGAGRTAEHGRRTSLLLLWLMRLCQTQSRQLHSSVGMLFDGGYNGELIFDRVWLCSSYNGCRGAELRASRSVCCVLGLAVQWARKWWH